MKAMVLREINVPLEVEDIEVDNPGPREVLVRTRASGVCHSDLHYVEGSYNIPKPAVLGHEAAGIIEAVGDQVTYVQPGDPVIMCLSVFCGMCEFCLRGDPHLCTRIAVMRGRDEPPRLSQKGVAVTQMAQLGSYAEMMLVHENAVVKVDDDVPFDRLALIGCGATTGLGAALNTAKVEPGSSVAVVGCGGVGLNAVQGAALAGALRIIAIDTVETKLTLATQFGATDVIDASGGDVVEKVRELTGGGVDYSFEAIGLKRTAEQCYEMLRDGGHRNDYRHDPRADQDRNRRRLLPAPRAEDTGQQHGLQPLPHRHAPLHRVLSPRPPQARRARLPAHEARPAQRSLSPT